MSTTIKPYRAFGNTKNIFVQGHVFSKYKLKEADPTDTLIKNIRAMYYRFSPKLAGQVTLQIQIGEAIHSLQTDYKGYFQGIFPNPSLPSGWHTGSISLLVGGQPSSKVALEILIPSPSEIFVISDIDDTFLVSHARQRLKKFWLLLSRNAHTRKTFEGAVVFYRALMRGKVPGKPTPFFYVSSSEWNLYDFIDDFCKLQSLPKGIFLLDKLKAGWKDWWTEGDYTHSHKVDKMRAILKMYQDQKFILIGDNGQHDPQNYSLIACEFPDQIKTIYIREVHRRRFLFFPSSVEVFFFKYSTQAIEHAVNHGHILPPV